MKKLILTAILLALGCGQAGGSEVTEQTHAEEDSDDSEWGTAEQAILVEYDGVRTLGQNTLLNDFSRCTNVPTTNSLCKFARPIVLSTDTIEPGAPIRYGFAVDNASLTGFGAWRNTVIQYINRFTPDLRDTTPQTPPWVADYIDVAFSSVYNVYFVSAAINTTHSAGATQWEHYVKPQYGGCTAMNESLPGTYQQCSSVTIVVDLNDLLGSFNLGGGATQTQETQYDANNVGQAVQHGMRLALGITGSNTAERRIEPGVIKNNLEIVQEQQFMLEGFISPIYGTWTSFAVTDNR